MDLGDSKSYLLSFCVNPLSHTMKGILNFAFNFIFINDNSSICRGRCFSLLHMQMVEQKI